MPQAWLGQSKLGSPYPKPEANSRDSTAGQGTLPMVRPPSPHCAVCPLGLLPSVGPGQRGRGPVGVGRGLQGAGPQLLIILLAPPSLSTSCAPCQELLLSARPLGRAAGLEQLTMP